MLKNYLKISWRYLQKNKVFSTINLLGLTLGFSCFMLLALFVFDELNFDRFHTDSDRMYRVVQSITEQSGESRQVASVGAAIAPASFDQIPEIEGFGQLMNIGRQTIGNDPLNRDYERIWIVNDDFFTFFDFKFLQGAPETALANPNDIVLTESTAIKYFGKANVVGEQLLTTRFMGTVSAVIEDFPSNSHIQVNTIYNKQTWNRVFNLGDYFTTNWTGNGMATYFKLAEGADVEQVEQKLTSLVTSQYPEDITYSSTFALQPLSEIHLGSSQIQGGMNVGQGNVLYVYMFSVVGALILLIACFNYMNLSTAAASRRTQEVGMRKSLGAGKHQLVMQYMGESFILSFVSLLLSLTILELALPFINVMLQRQLEIPFDNGLFVSAILLITVSGALVSSLYPAFFLSRLNPVVALKKEVKLGGGKFSVRKALVVAQFTVSIFMIAATLIVYQQLNFLQGKELGFKVDDLLVIDINSGKTRSQFESVKQEFGKLSEVQGVTVSSRVPGEWKDYPIANVEKQGTDELERMIFVGADEGFLNTYQINLLQGRNLRNDLSDSASVLISALVAERMGYDNPIGETISINGTIRSGDLSEGDVYSATIVGMVEDFHFQSFREEISPMILASYRNPIHNIDYYTLRIQTANWEQTLASLTAINDRFDSENPVEYTFLDNRFEQYYEADEIRGKLFLSFSGIIVFIALMGLFALSSFSIENRVKEIGVRKVLGASIADINWVLSKEFVGLIMAAFVISIPITYISVQSWLQEFAYKIPIPWWAFFVAGFVTITVAMGTISFLTVRAATMNPVKSLRSE